MSKLYKQRDIVHGVDGEELVPIGADSDSRTLAIAQWIWDTDNLEYIKVTKDLLSKDFPTFHTVRIEWSSGNCIYKGSHLDLNADTADTDWMIYKYDYDVNNNVTMIRVATGSWDNRAGLWV